MSAEFDRIPVLRLTLADLLWDDDPGRPDGLGITGLTRDGEHVVVTCAGGAHVLRLPLDGLVRVRRPRPVAAAPRAVDDRALSDQIADYYPGDIDSATAAFAAHSHAPAPPAGPTQPYPGTHYEGLYGGDLDAVVEAVGTHPEQRSGGDLREAAMRRRMADPHEEPGAAAPTGETDEELAARLSGWYAGDLDYVIDSEEP